MSVPRKDTLISFAKGLLQRVFGSYIPNCYLAGGAYKTLLHNKPPNDLDIFASSQQEREELVRLLRSSWIELPTAPGAQRFIAHEICGEVPTIP